MRQGFTLGVSGLVLREGNVLLVRRMHEPYKGKRTLPGGYVERHESMVDAVRREIREETGVEAEVIGAVGVRQRVSDVDNNLVVTFLMNWRSGEAVPDGVEVDEARFVPPDEILADPDVIDLTKVSVEGIAGGQERAMVSRSCPPTPGVSVSHYLVFVPWGSPSEL
ncbi:MAG: NUDIX domain-containing protein [Chloroflexi bacterium]|nr:NUDIX domain-containing protein [Chloroflexota bacterium]